MGSWVPKQRLLTPKLIRTITVNVDVLTMTITVHWIGSLENKSLLISLVDGALEGIAKVIGLGPPKITSNYDDELVPWTKWELTI